MARNLNDGTTYDAGVPLTPRQYAVLKLLGAGLPVRRIAERLALSVSTVSGHRDELLRRLGVSTTAQLRLFAQLETTPGEKPDDLGDVLLHQCGTLGARQALIAALARECGRDDVVLTVGCAELDLLQLAEPAPIQCRGPVHSLPLAVCYLRYGGRRLQYSKGDRSSQLTSDPNSETRVDPYQLADQRCRLYQDFASDWCQAFDMEPCEFARLRALCLQATRDTALFEDLLGHGLDPEFQPKTR